MEVPPAIRCAGLVKRYGDVTAVDGLDLEVARGECFGLLGPNGAGKTTTLEVLEGLLEPTRGDVEVLGRRWRHDASALRERLGITLQETRLPERLTVREIVRLFRSFYAEGRDPDEVIGLVSLEEKRDAWYDRLSGGQKQRLAVACALAGDPELLFLDEPTTGLDPHSRIQVWDLVRSLGGEGTTVVLTTQYLDEADQLANRIAVIDHGRVVAEGTPGQLKASVGAGVLRVRLRDPDQRSQAELMLSAALGDAPVSAGDDLEVRARVPVAHPVGRASSGAVDALVTLLRDGIEMSEFALGQPSLDEVFLALTSGPALSPTDEREDTSQ